MTLGIMSTNENYHCKRCGKDFQALYLLKKHLNRKHWCKPEASNALPQDLLRELERDRNNESSYFCTKCHLGFKSRSGLHYHSINCNYQESQDHHDDSDVQREITMLRERIARLERVEGPSSTTNVTNNVTNVTNNVTQNINNTTNIFIVPFGQENIDHILNNTEFLKKCCTNPLGGVPKLVGLTYFDPLHRENQNLACDEKFNIYIMKEDGKWHPQPSKATIDMVMDNQVKLMKTFFSTKLLNTHDYSHILYNGMQPFLTRYNLKDVETMKRLRKRTSEVIYEGTLRYNDTFLLTIPEYVNR
jgi:hypothetical protein